MKDQRKPHRCDAVDRMGAEIVALWREHNRIDESTCGRRDDCPGASVTQERLNRRITALEEALPTVSATGPTGALVEIAMASLICAHLNLETWDHIPENLRNRTEQEFFLLESALYSAADAIRKIAGPGAHDELLKIYMPQRLNPFNAIETAKERLREWSK